jgi:thiamine pyrophosphate-dependent acetolactate synthase large subunit-like protein
MLVPGWAGSDPGGGFFSNLFAAEALCTVTNCFGLLEPGFGVTSLRVETIDQVGSAIDTALAHNGPFLLDVSLEGNVHPEHIGAKCGQ